MVVITNCLTETSSKALCNSHYFRSSLFDDQKCTQILGERERESARMSEKEEHNTNIEEV